MLRNRKAQAVLELAILGALVITAFSIVIGYSEKYNREQSYMQQTFRSALKKAQEVNNSASWATVDFRRMPNVTNPVEIGSLGVFSSSNNVLWSDGKKNGTQETVPKAYFQLNRAQPYSQELPILDPVYSGIEISNFGYTSNLNSGTGFIKNEGGNNISTQKSLNAADNIGGSADMGGTKVDLGSSLGGGGVYSGGGLGRSRGMQ
jgi:uncharacterized protein (UPF0333 family)